MADIARSLDELFTRQRAHRAFLSDPIDDDVIRRLLESATRAPSAENRQPWQFVVVTETDRRHTIWALAARAWVAGGRQAAAATLTDEMHADVDHGITAGFAGAPVTIVVGADLRRCHATTIGSSVFPAVQNLLLAATAHGLGSALTTISTVFADDLREVVGFPDSIVPVAVLPIGRPARRLGSSRREPVEDHAHREVYGNGW